MCGIFGIVNSETTDLNEIKVLAKMAQQRGKDASGIIQCDKNYTVHRSDNSVINLIDKLNLKNMSAVLGHSRLVTNGHSDNQPVVKNDIAVLHNGIIVNCDDLWNEIDQERKQSIDSEILAALAIEYINDRDDLEGLSNYILSKCKGVVSAVFLFKNLGKLVVMSNNGSLYISQTENNFIFSSEEFPLKKLGYKNIKHVLNDQCVINIPVSHEPFKINNFSQNRLDLVPQLLKHSEEEAILEYSEKSLKRCSKCILPETMPYISFDEEGVCNYCTNYVPRNTPKDKEILFSLVEKYRRKHGNECILPFSGGRDSCYSLHLVIEELKLKPLTYTYDWGMITDLGRRNISRMCSQLGVENIIIADDITKKRKNIEMNIKAWLKNPSLGMISIFTAGDKHFFRHVETVKQQTDINLNLWGVNPLEVTHFKAGFLGVPPDFEEEKVYRNGALSQLNYQYLRFKEMSKSPGYFNKSLWDTLSGEYYRSFMKKKDYYHIFDYWQWDEKLIDQTLLGQYDWELAPDTNTTWRIGDGTAAFYNYIYYKIAGFTEHDTFRSNQIREGQLTREEALELVEEENRPRYPNLKWYLDSVGLDFKEVITKINSIPEIHNKKS